MAQTIKPDHLYKGQSKSREVDLDIVRAHAAHLCFDVHKHSKYVVCWPCQEEALRSYGYEYQAGKE